MTAISTTFGPSVRLHARVQNHDFVAYPMEFYTRSSVSLLIVFHQYPNSYFTLHDEKRWLGG